MAYFAGIRTRPRTIDTGEFWSPDTNKPEPYRLVRDQRWLTIMYVPLARVSRGELSVICGATGTVYETEVLDREITPEIAAATTGCVIAATAAAGGHDAGRRFAATDLIAAHNGWSPETAASELEAGLGRWADDRAGELRSLDATITAAAPLPVLGTEAIIGSAVLIAATPSQPGPDARELLIAMGESFGLDRRPATKLVDRELQRLRTPS